MEPLLNEDIKGQVREVFQQLTEPAHILFFSKKENCEECEQTRQLLEEVAELSDKLSIETYDLNEDSKVAARYHVDKAPGYVITAKNGDEIIDYGIRFYGIPSGHEFSSLIHDMILVSNRESGLTQETKEFLQKLEKPVHLMVFVTPTWPYCPRAVVLAHQMALESPLVSAEGIEANEFYEISDRFFVSGVPQTTINEGAGTVIGAVPEGHLVQEIERMLQAEASPGD